MKVGRQVKQGGSLHGGGRITKTTEGKKNFYFSVDTTTMYVLFKLPCAYITS